MYLLDANVLIYAVNTSERHHRASADWLDESLGGVETVGFPVNSLLAFIRLTTRVGLFPSPLPVADALAIVRAWTDRPPSVIVHPTVRHLEVLGSLLMECGTAGNLTNDAHLAALAVEHDATVATFDSDFSRFRGVRWTTPS